MTGDDDDDVEETAAEIRISWLFLLWVVLM